MASSRTELTLGIRNFARTAPHDWRHILDQARAAEAAGVDRLFVADHLVFGPDLSAYAIPERGGVGGGRQPTGPDGEWIEALTALTAMAAVTSRIRLATNVLVAPLRSATGLAKVAASIDVLSHGRLELGVGVGWQEAEYRAVGVDFHRRGRVLDDILLACRELWTTTEVSLETDDFALERAHMMPKPVQPGGVPVWIGGRVHAVTARRLARFGRGWIPWGVDEDSVADAITAMRPMVTAEGGDFDELGVAVGLPIRRQPDGGLDYPALFGSVPALVAAGVSDFRLLIRVPEDHDEARDRLEELVGHFRAAVDQGR